MRKTHGKAKLESGTEHMEEAKLKQQTEGKHGKSEAGSSIRKKHLGIESLKAHTKQTHENNIPEAAYRRNTWEQRCWKQHTEETHGIDNAGSSIQKKHMGLTMLEAAYRRNTWD